MFDKVGVSVDRIVVISLAHRQDRLDRFAQRWCYSGRFFAQENANLNHGQPYELFTGIDGHTMDEPAELVAGARGCRMSHLQVWARSVAADDEVLCVFEDDAVFREPFWPQVAAVMSMLPTEWDIFLLGGEILDRRVVRRGGLLQVSGWRRSHAYLVRQRALRVLHAGVSDSCQHLDYAMCAVAQECGLTVLAPSRWLCGQDAVTSDVHLAANARHPAISFYQ